MTITNQRPAMPASQILYGDTVYWLCVLAAIACMIGPMLALFNVDNNMANPHYLYGAIFSGKSPEQLWAGLTEAREFPGGHFWMTHFGMGDGFTQFGLALGGFVAAPALAVAALAFIKEKKYIWTGLALWVTFMIMVSCIGVVDAGH
jgi:hypothetical protein